MSTKIPKASYGHFVTLSGQRYTVIHDKLHIFDVIASFQCSIFAIQCPVFKHALLENEGTKIQFYGGLIVQVSW